MTKLPGRPRDAAIDDAILSATWTELNRVGYPSLTMTSVAEGAGVQKPALYRRWPTKPLLVIDTLARHLPGLTPADTGSLRTDLEHLVEQLAEAWSSSVARWSLSPLLADVASDEAAQLAFRQKVLSLRAGTLHEVLDRAVSRGELATDARLDVIGDLLEGPLMHRAMFGAHAPDSRLKQSIVDAALAVLCG